MHIRADLRDPPTSRDAAWHASRLPPWSSTSPTCSSTPSTTSPDREYLVCRRASAAPTPRWRSGRTGSPTTSRRTASAPATTSASTRYNSVEWVETLWAVFKIRAVWVNINYRYVEEELAYLFDNADLKALVYQREYAPRVRGVRDRLPAAQHTRS